MTRPNTYSQGSLREIAKILLWPMLKIKPAKAHLFDWLHAIFCVDDRTIERFEVVKDFNLSGMFYVNPTKAIPIFGSRLIKKGANLWIRIDRTMPDRIDVEVDRKRVGTQVYLLTRAQLDAVKPSIRPKPFRVRVRERPLTWLRDY